MAKDIYKDYISNKNLTGSTCTGSSVEIKGIDNDTTFFGWVMFTIMMGLMTGGVALGVLILQGRVIWW